MDKFQLFLDFLMANKVVLIGLLFAISEVLALIPGVKANSVFQAIFNGVKWLYDWATKPKV